MYFGTKKLFEKQPLPDCQTPSIEFGAGSFFFPFIFIFSAWICAISLKKSYQSFKFFSLHIQSFFNFIFLFEKIISNQIFFLNFILLQFFNSQICPRSLDCYFFLLNMIYKIVIFCDFILIHFFIKFDLHFFYYYFFYFDKFFLLIFFILCFNIKFVRN